MFLWVPASSPCRSFVDLWMPRRVRHPARPQAPGLPCCASRWCWLPQASPRWREQTAMPVFEEATWRSAYRTVASSRLFYLTIGTIPCPHIPRRLPLAWKAPLVGRKWRAGRTKNDLRCGASWQACRQRSQRTQHRHHGSAPAWLGSLSRPIWGGSGGSDARAQGGGGSGIFMYVVY